MLAPIKVKICDRNKNMLTAFGDKSAQVETQDGKIVIKKKEDILPTDRILTYIPNDYISPIKIKIIDLDIVFAFLLGELAKLAFFAQIKTDGVLILRFGKFKNKIAFLHTFHKSFAIAFAKFHEKISMKGLIEKGTSLFKITTKPSYLLLGQNIKAISTINEKYLLPQSVAFKIPPMYATIYALRYKTVEDITKDTIETQFLGEMTISDIFSVKEEV